MPPPPAMMWGITPFDQLWCRIKFREARYDGKFVLRINTSLPVVERFFRDTKSLLATRPIFHQWDATIRGHVFCSSSSPWCLWMN